MNEKSVIAALSLTPSSLFEFFKKYPKSIFAAYLYSSLILAIICFQIPDEQALYFSVALDSFRDMFLIYTGCLLISLFFFRTGLLFFLIFSIFCTLFFLGILSYLIRYDTAVEAYQFYAIWQTNLLEAYNFLRKDIFGNIEPVYFLLISIAFSPCLYYIYDFFVSIKNPPLLSKETRIIACIVLLLLLLALSLWPRSNASYLSMLYLTKKEYDTAIESFKRNTEKFKNSPNLDIPDKVEKDEILVVIIGESLTSKNMRLYGYFRNTTPKLSARDDLIVYRDVLSTYSHTEQALFHALTSAKIQRRAPYESQDFLKLYDNTIPVMAELNAADIETHWISAQLQFEKWGTLVSGQASLADHTEFINKASFFDRMLYDDAMFEPFKKAIKQSVDRPRSKIIFLHMMGSHTPYTDRYPPERSVYAGKIPIEQFDGFLPIHPETVNQYDNSVIQTDAFINKVIEELQSEKRVSAVIFFSDHGEDALTGLSHNGGKTLRMLQVPLIVWMSDDFRRRYPQKAAAIRSNITKKVTNEDVYYLILDMLGVKSGNLIEERSLASSDFKEKPRLANVETIGVVDVDKEYPSEILSARRASINLPETQKEKLICDRIDMSGLLENADLMGFPTIAVDIFSETTDLQWALIRSSIPGCP